MLTGQSDPRPRRSRPLLALAAGLPIVLAAMSGDVGRAAPASLDPLFDEPELVFPTPAPLPRRDFSHGPCPASIETRSLDLGTTERTVRSTLMVERSSTAMSSVPAIRLLRTSDGDASTGLDLEVRIGRIRIEFPWLKSLPITPGRHLVLDLMPSRS
jgi:hypothetical protein